MKKPQNSEHAIPPRLDYLAGLSWRLLVITGVIAVAIFLIIQLKVVIIPFLVALLVTALLFPFVKWLTKFGMKRGIAVAIGVVLLVLVVSGLGFLVSREVRSAYPDLRDRTEVIIADTRDTLSREPFNISTEEINDYIDSGVAYIQNNSATLASGVVSFGSAATNVISGIFIAFFVIIFLLLDGKNVWRWVVSLFPKANRRKLSEAGEGGWRTLISFVKSQVAVAAVDAVGIGLAAFFLQVPLALPIAVIVFIGSFVPIVGAILTGAVAVVLALIFNGWLIALIMLGAVLFVQFVESQLLQPFLIGKAVSVHPLAVVLAVAVGGLIAGIPGALFAVPVVAVMNVMVAKLTGSEKPEVAVRAKH
ncbi:AI-2E family transporter [Candidatus Saccharibacteria bacterium]|nr:AI-2E family transporter [Candidatus Saccharibacteria bacterium]|tara:strand:- start:1594 stop:2682 length:1089 start_codon:yes stop_codon:yes gene_type:complete